MMGKKEFSLMEVLQLLRVRWWILLLAAIIFAVGGGVYSYLTYEPTYSSDVVLYVTDQTNQDSTVSENYSQVNWALKVIKNYMVILKTDDFMEQVSDTYKERFPEAWAERPYTATRLLTKCVEYSATDETYIFTVNITTHDKEASYNLAKIFEELAPKRILDVTGKDAVRIADHARVATGASNSRNLARNTILMFFVGVVLSFLVVLIVDISDVRIKDEDDIIENYPVPLLGSIPNFESAKKKGYGYGKK